MAGIHEVATSPDSNLTDILRYSELAALKMAKAKIRAKPKVMRARMPRWFKLIDVLRKGRFQRAKGEIPAQSRSS
jgi:hypothetical protein